MALCYCVLKCVIRSINIKYLYCIFSANIGGNLGLFTGASALTAFQVFEYCFDEGDFQYRRSKKNKNKVGNADVSRLAVRPAEVPMRMVEVGTIMDYDTL